MPRSMLLALIAMVGFAPAAHAAPTKEQNCEAAMELASAQYLDCRLTAESKFSKKLDAEKRTEDLAKCSTSLGSAFTKATDKFGVACAATAPSSAFDDYLQQCSDDVTAAAAGAALPDYVGDLASCNESLTAASVTLELCEADLAACEALSTPTSPAQILTTGQTTSYGAGSDGDLELGIARGYVDNGDGTISDTKTGLMWEKKSNDGSIHDKDNKYTWSGSSYGPSNLNLLDGTVATTFLAGLNAGAGFAGHTDWRLPNEFELFSLANLSDANLAVYAEFNTACVADCTVLTCSCTINGDHWSSTTYPTAPTYAWVITFSDGGTYQDGKNTSYYARAVRSGS